MTGPQHYVEAERLLAVEPPIDTMGRPVGAAELIAAAQVHATLALLDATRRPADTRWDRVIKP